MESMRKTNLVSDPATIDEGKVRLGDVAPYFASATNPLVKAPPSEIVDEEVVRLGDGSIYF